MANVREGSGRPPCWLLVVLLLGLYLTFRGYRSRDGDQAYRLPLLLHRQDPALYRDDPFVRAFDTFNPHRGYLTLLDGASRVLGLSAALAALFALTFGLTCLGVDRLARAAWPEAGPRVGLATVVLVLAATAGNIGTNHLFEPTLLDRLIGLAFGWLALAATVDRPRTWGLAAPAAIAAAAYVHPSVGLQLGMLLGAGWVVWSLCPRATGVGFRGAAGGLAVLILALAPVGLALPGQSRALFEGLPRDQFGRLSAWVQSPQHMLPHLWRTPQCLAWACYAALALLALGRVGLKGSCAEDRAATPPGRVRLALLLMVCWLGLGVAWIAVERFHDLRATLFQPFRMATVARGLALVLLAGRVAALAERGDALGRSRAALLVVGLTGDWTLVVVTAFEVAAAVAEALASGRREDGWTRGLKMLPAVLLLGAGLLFLSRHDTESGHHRLLATLGVLVVVEMMAGRGMVWPGWTRRRMAVAVAGAWAVPTVALLAPLLPGPDTPRGRRIAEALAEHCRFGETAVSDLERLALWCREHTPVTATFIGPPGPKTFRLWSRRSLAFNRAGSPYHARGLADWAARFQDHVGFRGPLGAFVRAYLADRHGLERRYLSMTDGERAALARRQGATHVLAAAPTLSTAAGPLELLHVEGRFAVYRVRPRPTTIGESGTSSDAPDSSHLGLTTSW